MRTLYTSAVWTTPPECTAIPHSFLLHLQHHDTDKPQLLAKQKRNMVIQANQIQANEKIQFASSGLAQIRLSRDQVPASAKHPRLNFHDAPAAVTLALKCRS
ncbi:hypothetical protein CapIbe_014331 [Capra ibex]